MTKKRNEWLKRISEQRASGESIAAYCRRSGISKSSFEYWRAKLDRENGRFVTVTPVETKEVTIELKNGVMVRIPDLELLPSVLKVLDAGA